MSESLLEFEALGCDQGRNVCLRGFMSTELHWAQTIGPHYCSSATLQAAFLMLVGSVGGADVQMPASLDPPVGGPDQPFGKEADVEAQMRSRAIDCFLLRREEIDQQRSKQAGHRSKHPPHGGCGALWLEPKSKLLRPSPRFRVSRIC